MKKETLFNFFKPYYVSDTGQIIWHAFLLELILWARHANLHLRGEESEANRGDNRGSLVDTGRGRLWSQAQRPTVHAPPTPALCNETVAMKTNPRALNENVSVSSSLMPPWFLQKPTPLLPPTINSWHSQESEWETDQITSPPTQIPTRELQLTQQEEPTVSHGLKIFLGTWVLNPCPIRLVPGFLLQPYLLFSKKKKN